MAGSYGGTGDTYGAVGGTYGTLGSGAPPVPDVPGCVSIVSTEASATITASAGSATVTATQPC